MLNLLIGSCHQPIGRTLYNDKWTTSLYRPLGSSPLGSPFREVSLYVSYVVCHYDHVNTEAYIRPLKHNKHAYAITIDICGNCGNRVLKINSAPAPRLQVLYRDRTATAANFNSHTATAPQPHDFPCGKPRPHRGCSYRISARLRE